MRLSFHGKQFLVPSDLMGPARERNNDLAGPISARGRSAAQNRLGDIAQQQPAIFVSIRRSIRRSVLAKGRDGSDLIGHRQALPSVPRSVTGKVLKMDKRNLISSQLLEQARDWADELTHLEMRGPGDLEPAWRRLEARYGIPYSTFWSLRYRFDTLKDIWASLHVMLKVALDIERAQRAAQLSQKDHITALAARRGD